MAAAKGHTGIATIIVDVRLDGLPSSNRVANKPYVDSLDWERLMKAHPASVKLERVMSLEMLPNGE